MEATACASETGLFSRVYNHARRNANSGTAQGFDSGEMMTIILVTMARPKFALAYAPETVGHLHAIEHRYYPLIERTIKEQLAYAADEETRNRKPLARASAFGATWELRFGRGNRFRVFYDVDSTGRTVRILAIGVKEGNRLIIGGKAISS